MPNTQFFISTECPFHTLSNNETKFQYHIFIGPQRSIGQQKGAISNFKIYKKTTGS